MWLFMYHFVSGDDDSCSKFILLESRLRKSLISKGLFFPMQKRTFDKRKVGDILIKITREVQGSMILIVENPEQDNLKIDNKSFKMRALYTEGFPSYRFRGGIKFLEENSRDVMSEFNQELISNSNVEGDEREPMLAIIDLKDYYKPSIDANFANYMKKQFKKCGTVPRCHRCKHLGDLKKCSGCNSTYYCGLHCQKSDWHSHKLVCKKT